MASNVYVTLNNGYKCPAIGHGTYHPDFNADKVTEAVKTAIDVGYRHIDTAAVYFVEKFVGEALTAKIQEGVVKREDLFITSKLWCTFHRPDLVEGAIRYSLNNLGLEFLDLYLIHWPQAFKEGDDWEPMDAEGKFISSDVDYVDTWKAMETLVEKGLTRSIGLSSFNKRQLTRVLEIAKIKPAMLQIEVHPYLTQQPLIDFCRSHNIAVTAFSPLGALGRPWAQPHEPVLLDDPKIISIGQKYGKTAAQVAIRYAVDRGVIPIPKSAARSRIVENFNVFDFRLTPEDLQELGKLQCKFRFSEMKDTYSPYYPFHDEY